MLSDTVYPSQLVSPYAKRLEEILLVCHYDPYGISTVPETVASIQKHSSFSVTVLNMFEHGTCRQAISLSPLVNLKKFQAIVIHNSLSYNVENLKSLDRFLETPIRGYEGVKILMKQDENYRFRDLAKYIGDTGFDLIYTCLPSEAIPVLYPPKIVGEPRFLRMLTGYVTATLRSIDSQNTHRPIDIGYRGSIQPLSFGRLSYEKRKIGDDITRLLEGRGLRLDISSRWEDRLGSNSWFNFLCSCKATLGVESGASIFDVQGDLDARCQKAEIELGPYLEDPEYAERYLSRLEDLEGLINYNQISPRHFEAAATRTLQIMYPGEYSGIFDTNRHYIEIGRDYSNLDKAVDILLDTKTRTEVVDRAYEEIIQNKKYWIETFIEEFDDQVTEMLDQKGNDRKPSFETNAKGIDVLLLCSHKPSIDPRLNWIASGAPHGIKITQVGIGSPDQGELASVSGNGQGFIVVEPRISFADRMLSRWYASAAKNDAGWAGFSEIHHMHLAMVNRDDFFIEAFGAPVNSRRLVSMRAYFRFILDTTATIMSVAERVRGFDAVIATDLDTLPAALLIKGMAKCPAIYDAHEYWADSDVASSEFERQFWIDMERRLVKHVDYRQTVSPGLAELMRSQYNCEFSVVPNCEPLSALLSTEKESINDDELCRFVFQGNFAPGRGLELLINSWPETDKRALLLLRGPDHPYRDEMMALAKRTGLVGTRIFFPDAVSESKLVQSAQEGDVGLVPYTPKGQNYSNCCPNKISQYMAAGLPILANNTSFVSEVIKVSEAGIVVDFSNPKNIRTAVSWFVEHFAERNEMGSKGNWYFRNSFNWDVVSRGMYAKIESLAQEKHGTELRIFPSRDKVELYPGLFTVRRVINDKSRQLAFLMMRRAWRLLPSGVRRMFYPVLAKLF